MIARAAVEGELLLDAGRLAGDDVRLSQVVSEGRPRVYVVAIKLCLRGGVDLIGHAVAGAPIGRIVVLYPGRAAQEGPSAVAIYRLLVDGAFGVRGAAAPAVRVGHAGRVDADHAAGDDRGG